MEEILKYFPNLSDEQQRQLALLGELYPEWNEKINVISRRDIDNLYIHHVLHSLAIAKFVTPEEGTRVLDMGTGGGFPGIPLAILWPQAKLHLVDRIGKKIRVASEIAKALGLSNVTTQQGDIGEVRDRYDYVVSRAVMRLDALIPLVRKNISRESFNALPNGLITLKGGNLESETAGVREPVIEVDIDEWFGEEFFKTKKLIYVQL